MLSHLLELHPSGFIPALYEMRSAIGQGNIWKCVSKVNFQAIKPSNTPHVSGFVLSSAVLRPDIGRSNQVPSTSNQAIPAAASPPPHDLPKISECLPLQAIGNGNGSRTATFSSNSARLLLSVELLHEHILLGASGSKHWMMAASGWRSSPLSAVI